MPWKESKPMDQRVRLIEDYQDGESITALAETYGIARKTVYKWLERHAGGGVAALADRSRAPVTIPAN
jgi:putative transposase